MSARDLGNWYGYNTWYGRRGHYVMTTWHLDTPLTYKVIREKPGWVLYRLNVAAKRYDSVWS